MSVGLTYLAPTHDDSLVTRMPGEYADTTALPFPPSPWPYRLRISLGGLPCNLGGDRFSARMPEALPLSETSKIVLRSLLDHPELMTLGAIVDGLRGTEQLDTHDVSAALEDLAHRWLVVEMPNGDMYATEKARGEREAWLG